MAFLLCILLLLLLRPFGIRAQGIEDPTSTPGVGPTPIGGYGTPVPGGTPVYNPLYSTPTPVGTNYDCPADGLPYGWGLVTPSPLWLMRCGHCVNMLYPTATPAVSLYPTATPIPWIGTLPPVDLGDLPWYTPTPTATPVITVTPIPTPTPIPLPAGFRVTYGGVPIQAGEWVSWTNTGSTVHRRFVLDSSVSGITACVGIEYYGYSSGSSTSEFWRGPTTVRFLVDPNEFASRSQFVTMDIVCDGCKFPGGFFSVYGQDGPVGISAFSYLYPSTVAPWSYNPSYSGRANVCVYNADLGRDSSFLIYESLGSYATWNTVGAARWFSSTFDLSPTPTPPPTPVPTSTPTPPPTPGPLNPTVLPGGSGYCDSVEGVSVSDPIGISLPEFGIGSTYCYGVGSVPIPFGDGEFPGIQICFTEIEFGSVNIVGIEISLDLLASIAAGVALIRLFLRS